MAFKILHQDDCIIAIEKPAGFIVHAHENPQHQISNRWNCLYILNRQLKQYLYPVHRIDRATSGVLVFALNKMSAANLQQQFREKTILKKYYCVARGFVDTQNQIHTIDENKESITNYRCLKTIELPYAIGRYPTARYSLVEVHPITGRLHQIRKHFSHISHHLIGDRIYGDGKHNLFFRNELKIDPLLLKSYSISFTHPKSAQTVTLYSHWTHAWHQVFDLFNICPYSAKEASADSIFS